MRTALLFLAFATVLPACSFSMQAGTGANDPNRRGRRPAGVPVGPTPAPVAPSVAAKWPAGTRPVSTPTVFGGGTNDVWKGAVYWTPDNATAIPALDTIVPTGLLYAREINVAPQTFAGGFPGLDSTHLSDFAIRYEAALNVSAEADYDFRLVADDGAILKIDNTVIIDNNGVKTAPVSKEGPVHLVVGNHTISIDYFQTNGPVALQLFCKKVGEAERVCPTSL